MYYNGQGVDVNYKKAFEWHEKAAEQGYASAQHNMGVMYHNGHGVDVNYEKAIEWYEKAAEQGHGQRNLGVLYELGMGVDQDDAYGNALVRKGRRSGPRGAQAQIAELLKNVGRAKTRKKAEVDARPARDAPPATREISLAPS